MRIIISCNLLLSTDVSIDCSVPYLIIITMDGTCNDLPELKKAEVDHIVDLYKNVFQPTVSLVHARISNRSTRSLIIIQSEWRQRNLERGSWIKILRSAVSDASLKSCIEISAIDVSHWGLHSMSKSEKLKAVVHTISTEGQKNNTKYYLEIWSEEKSLMTFNLADLELHGIVYTDATFGSLSWTEQEDKVAYIAEKNPPKTAPFYQQKAKTDSSSDMKELLVGKQYEYEADWGEQLSPKRQSVIAVCDISTKRIGILDGLPDNICPGNVIWDPSGEGIVGVGYYHKPRRSGIIFCTNIPSCIFYLTLSGKYSVLSDEEMSVMSPRFSPNGKYLIWLQCRREGPHETVKALVKCDWNTKKVTTVFGTVNKFIITKNGKEFYGIFTSVLPHRCWTSDSRYILFSTVQKYRINSYSVDINDGSIWDIGSLDEDESTSVLDVSENDYIICNKTSLKQPNVLTSVYAPSVIGKLGIGGNSAEPHWNFLSKPAVITDKNIISRFTVYDLKTKEERCFATYYGPQNDQIQSTPVILFIHGGPHSSVPSVFNPALQFFTCAGFGVVIVHYRGSLGCGQDHVNALLGHIGSLDVSDCYAALQNALKKFSWLDGNKVVLFGGSHGGFIITHLTSQFPDAFKATVTRNPVTNIPAKIYSTDIPEHNVVECGFQYDGLANVMQNLELWNKMADVSPVKNIKNVTTPTLLMLGKKDLRVPTFQGLSYYHMLKELKVISKVLLYDDNHSLNSVSVELDSLINAIIWFKRCLKRKQSS